MSGPDNPSKVSSLRDLPQAIEPARDLWPQIEARIRQQASAPGISARAAAAPRRPRQPRWLAAAAMVASVAVGVWIGRTLLPVNGSAAPRTVSERVPPAAAPADSGVALDAAYVSDPRYQRQRTALLRALQSQLASLPAPTRNKVRASLATLEKAKQDLETALGKEPGNALLQELLVNTYQDEMRVLTDVHEASDPGRGI